MKSPEKRTTKRGFVMTGGGAKGLYEAGVIHAFHLCGLEFDVITGSSIGAINAIYYAEYLWRKHQLPVEVRSDPVATVDAMDEYLRAFLHAWWNLPETKILDDSDEGPLGQLVSDLTETDIGLPLLVRLGWWWTDPHRWDVPPPQVWPHLLRLGKELLERLGDGGELFRVLKRQRHGSIESLLRAYLTRFGIEQSLVPATPNVLRRFFVEPVTPLRAEHLESTTVASEGAAYTLIPAHRSFAEYLERGIDVRLTRANYRTGRLELSAFTPIKEFLDYLEGRTASDIVIGSSRVVVPGNPNVINAAIASGRFPGVFAPFAVTDIYPRPQDPAAEPENALLYGMLENGLEDEAVRHALYEAYRDANPALGAQEMSYVLDHLYPYWAAIPFPRVTDTYVDGGAIDNTPTNSAIDAIREGLDRQGESRRDYVLDLYVVFLHSEPNPGVVDTLDNPALYQVVTRTLKIQGAAKLTSDAGVVKTINHFGRQGEELGRQTQLLLDGVKDLLAHLEDDLGDRLTEEERHEITVRIEGRLAERLQEQAETFGFSRVRADTLQALLDAIQARGEDVQEHRLPLEVKPVEIYPDVMELETLQFTERLGFKKDKAIAAITMGCYNTMWRLRNHLEDKEGLGALNYADRRSLQLVRHWMGTESWPRGEQGRSELEEGWQCQRTACIFHAMHCRHGQRIRRVVHVSISR